MYIIYNISTYPLSYIHIYIYIYSDFVFKIVLVGDTCVGKSSILLRFSDDVFSDTYVTTIGVDFVRRIYIYILT